VSGNILTPEDLLNAASLGKKLKPKERRDVVLWLEKNGKLENYGEVGLANIFGCKPSAIRDYVRKARRTIALAITEEDAMSYMADFLESCNAIIKECKKALADTNMFGQGLHPVYMRLLKETEAEKIEKLQSIGVIPKELGRMTSVKEEWEAVVSDSGVASVHEVGSESE
jgi:hypothetical protein